MMADLLLAVKFHLIILYSYFFTFGLILQSPQAFSPVIVSATILGNEKNHYYVMW